MVSWATVERYSFLVNKVCQDETIFDVKLNSLKIIVMKHLVYIFVLLVCSCTVEEGSKVSKASDVINVDGIMKETSWQLVNWRPIDQKWLGETYSKTDFHGRYKLLWDEKHVYVLAEITDDKLIDTHEDGLIKYWDDDCLEIFIDSNNSKGIHQYNHNAFAYHIALDGKVTDIGTDSIPRYYDHIESKRITEGNVSIWEAAISLYDDSYIDDEKNTPLQLMENKKIGFAIAYCDNDNSEERENFIGSTFVEGEDKNRGWIDAGIFEEVVLTKK